MSGTFILFDFDGVISDSFALVYDVARIVHPELDLTPDTYRGWFEGNVYDSVRKALGGETRHERYFAEIAPRIVAETKLVPGMDEVVRALAGDHTLVIISSTTSPHIRDFLGRHGLLEYFADVMGSDVHTSKVEKMRMAFEKHGTTPDHCVFVTDTLGDIREAKEHEVGAIGVSWGWHSHEILMKGIPFRIVDTPVDLPDAVQDYFAHSADS